MPNLKPRTLPFYGNPSFRNSLRTSSNIRKTNPLFLLFNRIASRILLFLAFHCPINSWRIQFHRWRGVKIGKGVFIGMHNILDRAYPEYITIEDNAMLAGGNHLLCHSRAPEFYKGKLLSYVAPIVLKKHAWIGIHALILPGVTVGEGSVVTAGSVVSEDVPNDVIVRGNPANIIKRFQTKKDDSHE